MSKEEAKLRAENEALKAQLAEQSQLVAGLRAEADALRNKKPEAAADEALCRSLGLPPGSELRDMLRAIDMLSQRAASEPAGPTVPAVALVPLLTAEGKHTHAWEAREYQVPMDGGRSVVPKGDVLRHPEAKVLAAAHLREVTTAQGREAGW